MGTTRKRQRAWARWLTSAAVSISLMPAAMAVTPLLADYMIVSNREGDVLRFDLQSGVFAGTVAKRGENGLNVPYGMTLGPDGKPREDLFVADKLHFNAAGNRLLAERVRPYLPK